MEEIVLSREHEKLIEEALAYLDPASNELVHDMRGTMSDADWEFVLTYMRRRVRSALEIESLARSLVRAATKRGLCDQRGTDHIISSIEWKHNFGVSQTADDYFAALSGTHEGRLTTALDALIAIARDRLFGTLDEEYERLLNPR